MKLFLILVDDVGSEQTLKCKNVNRATFCLWQRQQLNGEFTDLPNNDEKYYKKHTQTMKIKKLNSNDSGVYRCRLFWKSRKTEYSKPIKLCKYIFRIIIIIIL